MISALKFLKKGNLLDNLNEHPLINYILNMIEIVATPIHPIELASGSVIRILTNLSCTTQILEALKKGNLTQKLLKLFL